MTFLHYTNFFSLCPSRSQQFNVTFKPTCPYISFFYSETKVNVNYIKIHIVKYSKIIVKRVYTVMTKRAYRNAT